MQQLLLSIISCLGIPVPLLLFALKRKQKNKLGEQAAVPRAHAAAPKRHLGVNPSERQKLKVLITQLCLTLCDPKDYSLLGSSVHGILQTRILEWTAIPFSRGHSQLRN